MQVKTGENFVSSNVEQMCDHDDEERSRLKRRVSDLEEKNKLKSDEVASLREAYATLGRSSAKLEEENQEMDRRLQALRNQLSKELHERDILHNQCSRLAREIRQKEEEIQPFHNQLLSSELLEKEKEINSLRNQLSNISSELHEKEK